MTVGYQLGAGGTELVLQDVVVIVVPHHQVRCRPADASMLSEQLNGSFAGTCRYIPRQKDIQVVTDCRAAVGVPVGTVPAGLLSGNRLQDGNEVPLGTVRARIARGSTLQSSYGYRGPLGPSV